MLFNGHFSLIMLPNIWTPFDSIDLSHLLKPVLPLASKDQSPDFLPYLTDLCFSVSSQSYLQTFNPKPRFFSYYIFSISNLICFHVFNYYLPLSIHILIYLIDIKALAWICIVNRNKNLKKKCKQHKCKVTAHPFNGLKSTWQNITLKWLIYWSLSLIWYSSNDN